MMGVNAELFQVGRDEPAFNHLTVARNFWRKAQDAALVGNDRAASEFERKARAAELSANAPCRCPDNCCRLHKVHTSPHKGCILR